MALPKIYLSSRFATSGEIETAWLKRTGCKYRCFAYANLDPTFKSLYSKRVLEGYQACLDNKIGIMMDSSAHSLHRLAEMSGVRSSKAEEKSKIDVVALREKMFELYTAYCKKNKKKWDFYFTLDYARHQPSIYEMQKRFHSVGLAPLPVYHGDVGLDWLLKYKDLGHDFIGIATSRELRPSYTRKRYFLDGVFNFGAKHGIKFHGLAFTSMAFMTFFPWYSVDSSTWTKCASFGLITVPNVERNIIGTLHVSEKKSKAQSYNDLDAKHKSAVKSLVKEIGFDIKELATSTYARHDFNGYVFSNLDKLGLDFNKQKTKKIAWEGIL